MIREFYLNYIKQINFLFSSEWTEESEQKKWTRFRHLELFKILLFTFTQSCSLKNSKQKKVNKIQIFIQFYLNYIKQINFLFSNEWTEESEQKKWTRSRHLELFKIPLFTFTQSCSLKNSKQKKVNKIKIFREFYLNYIKQINFIFSSEWRGKWTKKSEYDSDTFLFTFIQSCSLKNNHQRKVNKIQILRTFHNSPVHFYSMLFTQK
jgi:hypothetical protein